MKRRSAAALAAFSCIALVGCASPDKLNGDISVYRSTKDQSGHELVNTEQFLVPVGGVVVVHSLKFEPGSSTLTPSQRLVVQQIFNSIEEITENTVNDTNVERVAKLKKMRFEIRGFGDSNNHNGDTGLAKQRAEAVFDLLAYLGTPTWRLKATAAKNRSKELSQVEFIRIR